MSGLLLHASTEANAFSLRFDTVTAETLAPHSASLTSSMRLVETPRYISIMASSTLVSRLR